MTTNNLTPWTYLGQKTDMPVDGDTTPGGENAIDDCGEDCLAMVTGFLRGVYVPVDTVKDETLGQNKLGVTSVAQLCGWFTKYTNPVIATSEHYPAGQAALISLIKGYIDAGQPIIELRYFQYPGNSALHWVADNDYDSERIYYANPWSGKQDSELYGDHAKMSRFVLVGIDETRNPNF